MRKEHNLTLHGLLNSIDRLERFSGMLAQLRSGEAVGTALPEGAKPFMIAALQQRLETPILVVTTRPGKARELQEQIATWSVAPERVLLFPEPDALPYERMPLDPIATTARLTAMMELATGIRHKAQGIRTQDSGLDPQNPELRALSTRLRGRRARAMMGC